MAVANPYAPNGRFSKIPGFGATLAKENFNAFSGNAPADMAAQAQKNTQIAAKNADMATQTALNAPIAARAAAGMPATATTPATPGTNPVAPKTPSAITEAANKIALTGPNRQLVDQSRELASGYMADPNMGFDYNKYNRRALDQLSRDQSNAFEAAREQTADTSGSGWAMGNMTKLALDNALNRNTYSNQLEADAMKSKQANIGNALAAGSAAQGMENSTIGQALSGLASATNIDVAQKTLDNLSDTQEYRNLMETFTTMGGTDNPAAMEMLARELPLINSMYNGTDFAMPTTAEKAASDAQARKEVFMAEFGGNPEYVTKDASGNQVLTEKGQKKLEDTFLSSLTGQTTTQASTMRPGEEVVDAIPEVAAYKGVVPLDKTGMSPYSQSENGFTVFNPAFMDGLKNSDLALLADPRSIASIRKTIKDDSPSDATGYQRGDEAVAAIMAEVARRKQAMSRIAGNQDALALIPLFDAPLN